MKRSLNKHNQSQEILSWFSDGVDQWLSQRPSNNDKRAMSFRLCTHGFLAVSMIVPQSLNPQGSKDTPYTFDEVTVNFKKENRKNFLKYLNLYLIK